MNWLNDMTMAKKLLFLTIVSAVMIGVVGFIGYYFVKTGNDHLAEVNDDHMVMLGIVQDMRQQTVSLPACTGEFLHREVLDLLNHLFFHVRSVPKKAPPSLSAGGHRLNEEP